jgi:GT2 family glycosyltransferase
MAIPPKVAIVILNWNGKKLLEKFLPSVIETNYKNIEFVVIDNDSSDDSVKFLKENYPQIAIVQNQKNFGFAGGYNEGLNSVEADYFMILNSDVEVPSNWLLPLVQMMEKDTQIGVVQPKIIWEVRKTHFEYAGAAGGFIDKWGYPFCRGRVFEILENDNQQYDSDLEVFWATGACMLIKADLFRKAQGFDTDFFAHMEEIDLCWRLKNMGYKIMCCARSVVYHYGGGTLPSDSPNKTYLNFRNSLIALIKNYHSTKVLLIIVIRFFMDFAALLKFVSDGDLKHAFAINRAHFAFLKSLPKSIEKRRQLKKLSSKTPSTSGVYGKSIVIEHFYRKTNVFSDLDQQLFSK